MKTTSAAFAARTNLSFVDAVERCRGLLADEGFGVLTEIDVQATLKAKLELDRDPFLILGACHPPSAHRALEAEPEVGVMLPCNVTVSVEDGAVMVRAMNPGSAMGMFDNPALESVATEVAAALQRVIAAIETDAG